MKGYDHNHYNAQLKEYARELRTETVSKAEKYIWKALLSRKQTGTRFLRQRPIDRFIVDFFAPEIGLVIEIDGNSHADKGSYDRYRENRLRSFGYEIIHFGEGDVLNAFDEVCSHITHAVHYLKQQISAET
jgi:very-short-patch-repair endonuclease